tara:strand:- start:423 stop:644 length:222 start_codon:yes stop_codon:yes gene_type:complete
MQNSIYHNNKTIVKDTIRPTKTLLIDKKKNTDINKLLNRLKVNQKNEKKNKIIFLSSGILFIGLTGLFLSIIN